MTKNAIIESVTLGFEGHGILSCSIVVNYGDGGSQAFGGYNLNDGSYLLKWIKGLLETFEIEDIQELKHENCRVELDSDGYNAKIISIGHIVKDKWFKP